MRRRGKSSRPGWTQHEQVEMTPNPLGLGQVQDLGSFQATARRQVQFFHRGLQGKVGDADTALETVVGAAGDLHVEQQAKTLLKGQLGIVGAVPLLL